MKLIGIETARVGSIFAPEEIRPATGVYWPDAIKAITERYEFAVSPDLSRSWEEINKAGLQFRMGRLLAANGQFVVSELGIYKEAILAVASSTDDGEAFLDDLLDWGEKSLGYRNLTRVPRKFYVSEVVVEFEESSNQILRGFDSIVSILNSEIRQTYDIDVSMQLSQFTLSPDPTKVLATRMLTNFLIERRLNEPFERERYFCRAPLRNSDHVKVLEAVERAISSTP